MGVSLLLIPVIVAAADAIPRILERAGVDGGAQVLRIPTRMKDAELLRASLHDYGCSSVQAEGSVHSEVQGARVVFQPAPDGTHEAVFVGQVTDEQARAFVDAVQDEYVRHVQARVYDRLKSRARERGMRLEAERVERDNTVTLRFAMPVTVGG